MIRVIEGVRAPVSSSCTKKGASGWVGSGMVKVTVAGRRDWASQSVTWKLSWSNTAPGIALCTPADWAEGW